MRTRSLRRTLFALVFAAVPAVTLTACELAFDFDRTPLQPVYEGGAGTATDAGHDSGQAHDSGGAG